MRPRLWLSLLATVFLTACASHRAPAPHRAQLVTEIFVRDVKASVAFYEKLGFRTAFTEATFAELQWKDGHKLFIAQRKNNPRLAQPAANVRIAVPDVDRYWQLAQAMKANIVTPIGDRFYHERDFLITDPDGFGLRFASLLPGGKW